METIFATAITLFLIMDPLGNVPVFLVVLSPVKEERRRRIILRELLIALAVMLIFLLAGPSMLRAIGVSREAVASAGQGDLWRHTLPALLLAWAASALILLSSPFLYRVFGNRGLKAMERLMGMVLICISVQMLLNAFAHILH